MGEMFTVGHSNHAIERFVDLLKSRGVEVVADVRSQPYSQFSPQFDSQDLARSLAAAGIKYVFLGKELGGRPEDLSFYDRDGRVLYALVAKAPLFKSGVEKLLAESRQHRVAMLCAEENPSVCHRRLLVTRVLRERGVEVQHIRGDGSLQSEAELLAAEAGSQLALFEDAQVREWRSIPSVLPKKLRSSSSVS
jgi:uncharacterized protein (DUF488 family)